LDYVFGLCLFLGRVVEPDWPTRGVCAQIHFCFFVCAFAAFVSLSSWQCAVAIPVIKKYLKREDAPKTLSKQSIGILNKRCLESGELENPFPPQQIGDFINSMTSKMNETKRKIETQETNVKSIIEELPDTKIDALHQRFSNTSAGTYTEDNLPVASKFVVDDITLVEQSIEHLKTFEK
jgi:hypothetical protein